MSKPLHCYTSNCPLAHCTCGHNRDAHADGKCAGVVTETRLGEDGKKHKTERACGCGRFEERGKGFVLDSGDPVKARIALVLEAPGNDEVQFVIEPMAERRFFRTQGECNAEIERRRTRYPDVPLATLKHGAPVVGKTGSMLNQWLLPNVGLKREELFLANTLRCLPPKSKTGQYPTGKDRQAAERCCRHYDRWDEFAPEVAVVTFHPAALMREITPLPLLIKDLEKARDFAARGKKVMVLLGGKAAKAFLRYAESVTRWRGEYRVLPADWVATYRDNFAEKKAAKKAPKDVFEKKPRKPRKRKQEVGADV